jgi:N-acetylmuramoyl-L-alanine amidase
MLRALTALLLWLPALAGARPLVVCVDPGHGGDQAGAKGPNKTWEKNLTLAISKRLAQKLRSELKAQVLLTRDSDETLGLSPRPEFANSHGADLFISIHLNSMPTGRERARVTGVETFFLSANASGAHAAQLAAAENAEDAVPRPHANDDVTAILDDLTLTAAHQDSSRLAYAIQESMSQELGVVDRGVQQAPFTVLNGAAMPAVLVEVGFISHPEEGALLGTPEYQEKVAQALLDGVRAFQAETSRRDVAVAPAPAAVEAQPVKLEAAPAPAPVEAPTPAPKPEAPAPVAPAPAPTPVQAAQPAPAPVAAKSPGAP